MCGNYSREETIQGRKLYEEIRYVLSENICLACHGPLVLTYFFNVFFSAKLYEVIFLLDKRENKNKDENLNVLQ